MANKGPKKPKKYYWEMLVKELHQKTNSETSYYYLPRKPDDPNNPESKTKLYSEYQQTPKVYKRYQLAEPFAHIYLTQRETESLRAIIEEKTITAAARKLQLSPRTIEFYFDNVKKKLNCYKKKDLMELIMREKLLDDIEM